MLSKTALLERCGGPAFASNYGDGMTLLDYLAGHALAGLLAFSPPNAAPRMSATEAGELAYRYAHAAIDARAELMTDIRKSDEFDTVEMKIIPMPGPMPHEHPEPGQTE